MMLSGPCCRRDARPAAHHPRALPPGARLLTTSVGHSTAVPKLASAHVLAVQVNQIEGDEHGTRGILASDARHAVSPVSLAPGGSRAPSLSINTLQGIWRAHSGEAASTIPRLPCRPRRPKVLTGGCGGCRRGVATRLDGGLDRRRCSSPHRGDATGDLLRLRDGQRASTLGADEGSRPIPRVGGDFSKVLSGSSLHDRSHRPV
jgi:hypothetical protein